MKKAFIPLCFVLVLFTSVFPQGWGSIVNLGSSTTIELKEFTNKDGHHLILKDDEGKLTYKLYSPVGSLIRSVELQNQYGENPNIIGNENEIYAIYLYDSQIIVKRSTNSGTNWSANIGPSQSDYNILAISADIDKKLYLAWNTNDGYFFSSKTINSGAADWTIPLRMGESGYSGTGPAKPTLTHISNYLFLAFSNNNDVYIHTYNQTNGTWNDNYETIADQGDIISGVVAAANNNKLFIFLDPDRIIGIENSTSSVSGSWGEAWGYSRPISGGLWTEEINLPSLPQTAITQSGQIYFLYKQSSSLNSITYNPSSGWSSSQSIFTDVFSPFYALSSYGNNVFAFMTYADYPNQTPLYLRPYNALPEVPTNLQLVIGTMTLLPEITWTPSVKSFVSLYEIWGKVGANGTWQFLKTSNVSSYTDGELYGGEDISYYYKIRAKSPANLYSAFSSEVSTAPAPPTGLKVNWGTMTLLPEISWNANSESVSYEVWGKAATAGGWTLVKTTAETDCLDDGIAYQNDNVTYNYRIRAKNYLNVYSGFSNIVNFIHRTNYKEGAREEISKAEPIPTQYAVQNFPNPFNPSTVINYDIPEAAHVSLKVYDILGRKVADLVNEYKEAGRYNVKFDASHLSTGIYIYQLRANDYSLVKKMNLVK